MDQSLLNGFFIFAAIMATAGSALIIVSYITKIRHFLESRLHQPKSEAQMYFDSSMALAMAETIPAAGVVANITGTIVFVNNQLTDLLHWRKDEMVGKSLDMIIPANSRRIHHAAMEDYRRTGHGSVFNKPMQLHCLMKGDIEIPVEVTIKEMIVHDKVFLVGKIRDMRLQLAEISFIKSKIDFYERVELLSCIGFFDWDFVNDVVFMTPGMMQLFDISEEHNNCKSAIILNCIMSTDKQQVGETLIDAVEKKRSYEVEYSLKTGKRIRSAGEMVLNENGEVMNIIGAVREVKNQISNVR